MANTLTPLQLAATLQLLNKQGFDINPLLLSSLHTYNDAIVVSPSEVSPGLGGSLEAVGDSLYNVITYSTGEGELITTYTVRNLLGSLSALLPGAWAYNGTVYKGAISALGSLVAEQLNTTGPAGYNTSTGTDAQGNPVTVSTPIPWLVGRINTYYKRATGHAALGATTIPALTATIPAGISGISGWVTYYIDQAINNVTGQTGTFDFDYFINVFTQSQGFIFSSNQYITALNNSSANNFSTYRVSNYTGLISQGWNKYQTGRALRLALGNIGRMTDSIPTSWFGTSNGVALVLINRGLGNVGQLVSKLTAQRVNLNDILNERYTLAISAVLLSINDPKDLEVIQGTIESTIPNMRSAFDYTDLEACAGIKNDSEFASLEKVGIDLYTKAATANFTTGADIVDLIDSIQSPSYASVESLAGDGAVLNDSVVASLTNLLPVSPTGTSITILDVIGTPSGYYADELSLVNEGIAELNATAYGPQIRSALNNISIGTAGAVAAYEALLTTIVNDRTGNIQNIVNKINGNYYYVCSQIARETQNWAKAKFSTAGFSDVSNYLSFAQSMSQYASDTLKIKTDVMLLGMAQDNDAGQIYRSLIAEAQNYDLLKSVGIQPNGYVG